MNISNVFESDLIASEARIVVVKKKLPEQLSDLINTLQGSKKHRGATIAEGRCLLKAFCEIRDPSLRAIIVELVEKLADKAKN